MSVLAPDRIVSGVALLDEIEPYWDAGLDVSDLDIDHPALCVLGKLGGSCYQFVTSHGGLDLSRLEEWGFMRSEHESPQELTKTWSRFILDRQAERRAALSSSESEQEA